MDANEILKSFKKELDDDKKELGQVDILIKTAKDAGENTLALEQTQSKIKISIKRWEDAIMKNIK